MPRALSAKLGRMTTQPRFSPAGAARPSKPPAQRVAFDERYKVFRNQLRKFSLDSIVQVALGMTAVPPGDVVEALKQFPWLPMLIAKWALLDRMVLRGVGQAMSRELLARLVNELWNFDGDLIKQPSPGTAHLLIRPRVFVQIEFQRSATRSFVRIPTLLSRLPSDHSLRRLFRSQWELSPEQFIDLSVALHAARLQADKPGFTRGFFMPLAEKYGAAAIESLLGMFAKDLAGLPQELVTSEAEDGGPGLKSRRRSELLEFPYFKRFPLFKAAHEVYFVWHPTVLARALEEAVHLRFSNAGEDYTRPFSKVFERYVVELAESAHPCIYTEADIKQTRGSTSVSVEAIIPFEGCNVLVEAKMGLYRDEVMTLTVPDLVRHKFRDLRKAVGQGASVAELLQSGALQFDKVAPNEVNYLLVVTSRDLCIGRGEVLDAMCQPKGVEYPSDLAKQLLPLEHVFYVSIEAFEHIIAAVKAGFCTLPGLLSHAVALNRNPATASYWLDLQMSREAQGVEDSDSMMAKAWDASLQRLEEALGVELVAGEQ